MAMHLFGVAERHRATQEPSMFLRLMSVLFGMVFFGMACAWWNKLLDPHETLKITIALAGAGLLAFVYAAYLFRESGAERPLPKILLFLLLGVGISSGLSAFFAADKGLALFGVAGSIAGSAAMVLAVSIFFLIAAALRIAGWKPSWSWMAGVYLVVMALACAQRLGWVDLSPGGEAARVFSPVGNALMVGWASVLMLAGAFSFRVLPWSRWLVIGAGIGWLAWLDYSEMWIALLIALLGGQFIRAIVIRTKTESGAFSLSLARIGSVIALVLWVVPIPRSPTIPTLITTPWVQSVAVVRTAWQEAPFFGIGQGKWSSYVERIRPVEMNTGPLFALRFDTGANWWLTSAAEGGIMGLLLRALFFLALIIHLIRLARDEDDRVVDIVLVLAGFAIVSFAHPYTWLLAVLFAVFGYAAGHEYAWPSSARRSAGVAMTIIGLMAIGMFFWEAQRLMADRAARAGLMSGSSSASVVALESAVRRSPWVPDYAIALVWARSRQITDQLRDSTTAHETLQQSLVRGVESAKNLTARWPVSADAWMARGGLYLAIAPATQGADQFAIQAYQEGMKYAPQHPGFSLGIANVYIRRAEATPPTNIHASTTDALAEYRLEQRRLAAEWLRRALEKKPDDQGILYAYATNLVRAGEVASAVPIFKSLAEKYPDRRDIGLEYATVLALTKEYDAAIALAERVSSADALYGLSRKLLTDWYVAKQDWTNALLAWKAVPASEQNSPAFRTRLRELQSKAGTTERR